MAKTLTPTEEKARLELKRLNIRAKRNLYDFGLELLKETPVMALEVFEQKLFEQMKSILTAEDFRPLAGQSEKNGRKRWQNLVDWVKANLTMNRLIVSQPYPEINGEPYLVYLESVGHVDGVSLCRFGEAKKLVRLLMEIPR